MPPICFPQTSNQHPSHTIDEAKEAKSEMNGTKLDGYTVRVDFSVTKEPQTQRERRPRDVDRELDAYIPNKRLAERLNYGYGRRDDRDRYNGRRDRGHPGGNNPAVDAKTGRREEWMNNGRYKGGYLSSQDNNYHANTTYTKEDFEAEMAREGKLKVKDEMNDGEDDPTGPQSPDNRRGTSPDTDRSDGE